MTYQLQVLSKRQRVRLRRLCACAMMAALTVASPLAHAQDMFENGGASESDQSATSRKPKAPPTPSTWEESDPAPPGYRIERRVRRNLIVQGAGLVVLAYSFSCFAAAAGPQTRALWVPVAGPYIQIPQTHSSPGDIIQTNALATTLLVFDALFQTIGAAMITYGLVVPERHLVKDDGGPKIAATPMTFWRGAGIGLVGSF